MKQVVDVYEVSIERFYHRRSKQWKVSRVNFNTNMGMIHYKPFKERQHFKDVSGKKVSFADKEMVSANELNTVVLDVSNFALEQGLCKIKVNFQVWKRKQFGDYQYMQEKDIKEIEIVPLDEKVASN